MNGSDSITRIQLLIGCRHPFWMDEPRFGDLASSIIEELVHSPPSMFCAEDPRLSADWSARLTNSPKEIDLFVRNHPRWDQWRSQLRIVVLEARVRVLHETPSLFRQGGKTITRVVPGDYALRFAVAKYVHDLALAAAISAPGSLEVIGAILIAGGQSHAIGDHWTHEFLRLAIGTADKSGWPKLERVPLATVWDWCSGQPGFCDSFGGGRTGRAVNALSRILETSSGSNSLIWAMLGLEALFADGSHSVMSLLRHRLPALLGEHPSAAKGIKQMYGLRSRLLHGDLDIAGAWGKDTTDPRVERQHQDESDATDLAVALLVASLQRLVTLGWNGLQFEQVPRSLP